MPVILTPEVATKLAEMLLAGRTRPQISAELGCGVRTVSTWRKSPLVLAELERLRSRSDETRAVDVLLGLLDSADERIRLESAKLVLAQKIQRAPEEPLPPAPPPEVPDGFVQVPLVRPVIPGA